DGAMPDQDAAAIICHSSHAPAFSAATLPPSCRPPGKARDDTPARSKSVGKLPEWGLVRCQLVAQPIELIVLPGKFLPKGAIGVDAHPSIDGHVAKFLRAIPQQQGLDVTGS